MTIYKLPSYALKTCTFNLNEGTRSAGVGGSTINVSRIYTPLLEVSIQTPRLSRTDRQLWKAWKLKLEGGIHLFRTYDASNARPLNYLDKSSPGAIDAGWNGQCNVTSIGLSGALGLSGLPEKYQLIAGDPIGLIQNGKYDYYIAVEDKTAIAGACTVTVRPFLRNPSFTAAAIAILWQPTATFVIDPESWNDEGDVEHTPISFTGTQRI